jgi:hypothetical protein
VARRGEAWRGAAQRIKLARELSKRDTGKTLYPGHAGSYTGQFLKHALEHQPTHRKQAVPA